jgi:hypothetical protein
MSSATSTDNCNTETPSNPAQIQKTETDYKRELDKAALKAHQKEMEEEEKSHESIIQKGIQTGILPSRPP